MSTARPYSFESFPWIIVSKWTHCLQKHGQIDLVPNKPSQYLCWWSKLKPKISRGHLANSICQIAHKWIKTISNIITFLKYNFLKKDWRKLLRLSFINKHPFPGTVYAKNLISSKCIFFYQTCYKSNNREVSWTCANTFPQTRLNLL